MVNEPLDVAYPDDDSPGVLVKLGQAVEGGVGPDGDIVAFSVLCPHKGWLLGYSAQDKSLNCPGHHSRFDCESGGQQIWGHATQNLPRVDDAGDIYAKAVDELIYGRLSNVLHLAIKEGTDIALLNAIMTEIVDQGWTDAEFIANSPFQDGVAVAQDAAHPASLGSLDHAMQSIRMSPDEAAEICGVPAADIAKAAEWIARPHDDGSRRKTALAYETDNVTNGVNELNVPDYKHCWGDIRKVPNATRETAGITFKSKEIVL